MQVAIVYDRVNKWGGAERVLLALHEMFPGAPLYTSVYDEKTAPWAKVFPKVYTSQLQNIPFARHNHEFFALLMPFIFSHLDFSKYDLVISVTSEFAKGIKTGGNTKHICYCLTPTRYLWSGYDDYFRGHFSKVLLGPIIKTLRAIDKNAAQKPDLMIAISTEVQKRIKKYYGRDSKIIFPPVNMAKLKTNNKLQKEKYYLLVSRLDYGYKKVDLAISAFNKSGKPLVIVGTGREEGRLRKMAKNNIIFAGRVDEAKLNGLYKNAKALIMPQEEDFGIVSPEAQSYGVPVIAYNKGGAVDTVVDGVTGILFAKQSVKNLNLAISEFEKMKFDRKKIRQNAVVFSKTNFKKEFLKLFKKVIH